MVITEFAQRHGTGWKSRAAMAAEKHAANTNPVHLAVSRVRACLRHLGDARQIAEEEFNTTHRPVENPLPREIHPDVRKILVAFLERSGLACADLARPVHPHEAVDVIEARHRDRLQRDLDEAQGHLAKVEREAALERLRAAQAALDAVDSAHARQAAPPPPVEAIVDDSPPVPDAAQVEAALAEQAPIGTDAHVEDYPAEPPRRRGRPPGPRISLDPTAPDDALPVNAAPV